MKKIIQIDKDIDIVNLVSSRYGIHESMQNFKLYFVIVEKCIHRFFNWIQKIQILPFLVLSPRVYPHRQYPEQYTE